MINSIRNNIEKYDEQDCEISVFLKDLSSLNVAVLFGSIFGALGGGFYAWLGNIFRKKFGDDIPVILILLILCLIGTAALYFVI